MCSLTGSPRGWCAQSLMQRAAPVTSFASLAQIYLPFLVSMEASWPWTVTGLCRAGCDISLRRRRVEHRGMVESQGFSSNKQTNIRLGKIKTVFRRLCSFLVSALSPKGALKGWGLCF